MNEENLTYADAMQRLEDISARLENGSVPLEESIALYEESAKLQPSASRSCSRRSKKLRNWLVTKNDKRRISKYSCQ